jgi:peptidoglycan-associated lipoprotein
MRPAPPPPVASSVLPGSERDFVVNVGDRVYFDTDQYNVRADAEPVLTSQASWLARYPAVQVRIEGNCDERGTREYNLALGARRASAIKAFLVARGVAPSRIATISYGKERPIPATPPGRIIATGTLTWSAGPDSPQVLDRAPLAPGPADLPTCPCGPAWSCPGRHGIGPGKMRVDRAV